ncbi:MAG: hypothetical protein Q4B58_07960, partial [Bacteroidales bacterium]|nr:hypothetical protein [Bacteroidales bacterium]
MPALLQTAWAGKKDLNINVKNIIPTFKLPPTEFEYEGKIYSMYKLTNISGIPSSINYDITGGIYSYHPKSKESGALHEPTLSLVKKGQELGARVSLKKEKELGVGEKIKIFYADIKIYRKKVNKSEELIYSGRLEADNPFEKTLNLNEVGEKLRIKIVSYGKKFLYNPGEEPKHVPGTQSVADPNEDSDGVVGWWYIDENADFAEIDKVDLIITALDKYPFEDDRDNASTSTTIDTEADDDDTGGWQDWVLPTAVVGIIGG